MAAPELTHVFDLTINGHPGFASKASPRSNLSAAYVFGGHLRSPDGAIDIPLIAGTDWMRLHENCADIDARVSVATKPGTKPELNCDLNYREKIAFRVPIKEMFKGVKNTMDLGQGYYYTTLVLESRSKELAWVNESVFVASGKITLKDAGDIEVVYRIFKVGALAM
ncbi:hypothetical protein FGADI_8328 [Fusarium gaditjirri]|uniref:Uncharacterized protein n=1 Tax=Fusarium gaditjirri TaxID=282569 RepID=A0A8H4WUA6_9HYPO|nr:hypothetical protein FGADI_8328 [Fusarium gaditjirri]